METLFSARPRRPLHSYCGSCKSNSLGLERENCATTNSTLPVVVRVPLERVELGSWKYTATELEDIELLYELESSDLLIRTSVGGMNGAFPATFRVRDVSAADLSLVNIVPGSPESMVARLVLETESDVSYNHNPQDMKDHEAEQIKIKCHRITVTASVHETGHLRDVLLFLKCGCVEDLSPDCLFIGLKRRRSSSEMHPLGISSTTSSTGTLPTTATHQVTFLEGLPFWAFYIPWRLYSKRMRVVIQKMFQLYLVFSVIWASWQLYRHVNVIHLALEPLVNILKLYLLSAMNAMDALLALFTVWWATFLNPLNVFWNMPVFRLLLQLRGGLASVWRVLSYSKFPRALKLMANLLKIICGKLLMPMLRLVLKLRGGFASLWRFLSYSRLLRAFKLIANLLKIVRGRLLMPMLWLVLKLRGSLVSLWQFLRYSRFLRAFKLIALYDVFKVFCSKCFVPVLQLMGNGCTPLWRFLSNSRLLRTFSSAFLGLYQLLQVVGSTLCRLFNSVWKWIANSRITEASLEFKRIRQSWVVGQMKNSVKDIGNGLAKFIPVIVKQKQIEVASNTTLTPSPPARLRYRQRRMPVYYSSPLTKPT